MPRASAASRYSHVRLDAWERFDGKRRRLKAASHSPQFFRQARVPALDRLVSTVQPAGDRAVLVGLGQPCPDRGLTSETCGEGQRRRHRPSRLQGALSRAPERHRCRRRQAGSRPSAQGAAGRGNCRRRDSERRWSLTGSHSFSRSPTTTTNTATPASACTPRPRCIWAPPTRSGPSVPGLSKPPTPPIPAGSGASPPRPACPPPSGSTNLPRRNPAPIQNKSPATSQTV